MIRLLRLFRVLKIARFQVLAEEFMEVSRRHIEEQGLGGENRAFQGCTLYHSRWVLGHIPVSLEATCR